MVRFHPSSLHGSTGPINTAQITDLAHSLVATVLSARGVASLQRSPDQTGLELPPRLASREGPLVRMFAGSLGYFVADALLIAKELSCGRKPHLWAGRLFHHVIQITVNAQSGRAAAG